MTRVSITRNIRVSDPNELPAWVPAPGTFANLGSHRIMDIYPALSSDVSGPFANWSGGIFAHDYGTLGAFVTHGSGHLTQGALLPQGVWVFDLDTLQWVRKNQPPGDNYEGDPVDDYGSFADGSVYPAHTYASLAYQAQANGGGTHGSLLRGPCPIDGIPYKPVLRFDLSQSNGGMTRIADNLTVSSSYTMMAWDGSRSGWWVMGNDAAAPLVFMSAADYSITSYNVGSVGGGGDGALIYLPDADALLATSYTGGYFDGAYSLHVLPLASMPNSVWVNVTSLMTGTIPWNRASGGVWSTLLGCVVNYCGAIPYSADLSEAHVVRKLFVPANLTSGSWEWTSETLVGAGGAVPAYATDSNNAVNNNGTFSRFVEAPNLRCFLWAGSVNKPAQAWRLTGM